MFVKTVAFCVVILSLLTAFAGAGRSDTLKLDETPAGEREWGYRPASQSTSAVTPPSFTWRPQKGIVSWEIECSRDDGHGTVEYRREGVKINVHCPPRTFPAGAYVWRYRGFDAKGSATNWSCAPPVNSAVIPGTTTKNSNSMWLTAFPVTCAS